MAKQDELLEAAEFDPRLPTYFLLQTVVPLVLSIVLIPVALLWLFVGPIIHRKQYENLACELTARTLNVRRGVLFKVQKSIPLDKITDLALTEGPILRYLGLCSIGIETAGGGQGTNMGMAMLHGVVDAEKFRDRVLEQRDRVALDGGSASAPTVAPASTASDDAAVLGEIRDTLGRIEQYLKDRDSA